MGVPLEGKFVITQIVDAMLPPGTGPGEALYIHVDLRASYYPPEDDQGDWPGEDNESRDLHLIFERPTNYTKVWSVQKRGWGIPKPEDFDMKSDHDSCWRTDGLSDLFSTWMEMRKALRERGAVSNDIRDFNTIRKIQRVKVTYEVKDPRDTHVKILTSIEEKG